jgi:hypothetical protein
MRIWCLKGQLARCLSSGVVRLDFMESTFSVTEDSAKLPTGRSAGGMRAFVLQSSRFTPGIPLQS